MSIRHEEDRYWQAMKSLQKVMDFNDDASVTDSILDLVERIKQLRELHKPRELFCGDQVCEICYDEFGSFGVGVTYPCPTIKVLDGDNEQG